MKLEFYQAPMLPLGVIIFYEYEKKKDERWFCDVITKLYYDKPFSFQKMCIENMLVPLDLSKDFDNELTLKNWLIDQNYNKIYSNDEYEIFTKSLFCSSRGDNTHNEIPIYAVRII